MNTSTLNDVQAKSPFFRYGNNKHLLAIVADADNEILVSQSSVRLDEAINLLQIIIESDHCSTTIESALLGVINAIETAKGMIDSVTVN